MNDIEIQQTVEALLGKRAKIIDSEKESSFKGEDVLLINGAPVQLEDQDDLQVKESLRSGKIPPSDLLNKIFMKLGLIKAPAKLESSLAIKSCVLTTEDIQVVKGGTVVDEKQFATEVNTYCYAQDTDDDGRD